MILYIYYIIYTYIYIISSYICIKLNLLYIHILNILYCIYIYSIFYMY